MIIGGVRTKAEQIYTTKAQWIRDSLSKHYPRKYNIIEEYAKIAEELNYKKTMMNQIYKLQMELHKLGKPILKVSTMIKEGHGLYAIKYKLMNKIEELRKRLDREGLNKSLKQRNNVNSVCVKVDYSLIQVLFRNRVCAGVFDGNTGITWGVSDSKMPKYIAELLD